MALALRTGIVPSVWENEAPEAIETAIRMLRRIDDQEEDG